MFHHQMKHREESWKYDAPRNTFDELRGVSSVDDDSVEYLILLQYLNKMILEGKIKDAIMSSFSSDFQKLILYFLYELLMSWESISPNCWGRPIPTFQSPNFRGRERLLQGLRWNLELTFTPKEQKMTTGKYILKLFTWSFLLLTTFWSAEFYSLQGLGGEWVFLLTLLMTILILLKLKFVKAFGARSATSKFLSGLMLVL